ncbi:FlgD immunoglobulin-like domain containing protein, partial [Candidatus Latescibacterota bacterium]
NDTIWAGTSIGLYKLKKSNNTVMIEKIEHDKISCKLIDASNDSTIYISDKNKLTRYSGGKLVDISAFTGPDERSISSIAIDQDNVKWFGHNSDTVSYYNDASWLYLEFPGYDSIGENIVVAPDNTKWFTAGWDGAIRYNGTDIEIIEIIGHYSENPDYTYALCTRWLTVDNNNIAYFATLSGETDPMADQTPRTFKYGEEGLSVYNWQSISIATDSYNRLWMISQHYKFRYFDENNKVNTPGDNLTIPVTNLFIDQHDIIWGFSNSGLVFFDGTSWTEYTTENSGLESNAISSISVDQNNTKWFGTDSGVSRFDDEAWTTLTTENSGLCDNKVNAIAVEKNNTIWIGTDNGVSKYTGEVITTSVDEDETKPEPLPLIRSYPNPFNPTTTIEFKLPETGMAALFIYNIAGQKVRELLDGYKPAGLHRVVWDGTDEDGNAVSAGVYIARLKAGDVVGTGKMVLVR